MAHRENVTGSSSAAKTSLTFGPCEKSNPLRPNAPLLNCSGLGNVAQAVPLLGEEISVKASM